MKAENWHSVAATLGFDSESEMLKNLYMEQKFSLNQLRHILGYSTYSIRRRLILLGIEMRARGGPDNRTGRRRLKHISADELTNTPASQLAERHKVHLSTVYAETRFRRKEMINSCLNSQTSTKVISQGQ